MRRLIVLSVLLAGVFFLRRSLIERAGPAMLQRGFEMCQRVLVGMPESFPPNRMMADLTAVKEQTARILELLEERETADEPEE